MDLLADRGRRVAIEELNTTRLLAHARKQAVERKLDDVLVADIDSQPDRMCLHIRQGKGGYDRYTLLPPTWLETLRLYWRTYRPKEGLFPNRDGSGPRGIESAQRRYYQARSTAGVRKTGGIHALRPSFATPLLEAGVDRVRLQKLLGHHPLSTTSGYLHLVSTQWRPPATANPLDLLATLPKPH